MTTNPSGATTVALRAVGRTYPGPPQVRALEEVDLVIGRGEYLAITGPSGSGKTTLLNLIGLLDRPTEGVYELDGTDVGDLSEAERTAIRGQRIGFVFQEFHLLPYRTAAENVMLALLYGGVEGRAHRHALASQALARVKLAGRASALPNTLSGGERQRVAIARALVNRPALLLCDEPTGNLDSATAQQILWLIDELHSDGQTVVVITHDAAVAQRAQRTVAILDGQLREAVPLGTEPKEEET
jgi:putative ABC transport system ATP-binding protein